MIGYLPVSVFVLIMSDTLAACLDGQEPCDFDQGGSLTESCFNFETGDMVTSASLASYFENHCSYNTNFLRQQCLTENIATCQNAQIIKSLFNQSDETLCRAVNQSVLPYLRSPEQVGEFISTQCLEQLFFGSNTAYCRNAIGRVIEELPNISLDTSDNFTQSVQRISFLYRAYLECTMTLGFYIDMQTRDGCQGANPRYAILAFIIKEIPEFGFGGVSGSLMQNITDLQYPNSDATQEVLRKLTTF